VNMPVVRAADREAIGHGFPLVKALPICKPCLHPVCSIVA
jgi:hypothetical protein